MLTRLRRAFSTSDRFNRDVLWNLGSLVILGVSGIVINVVIARFRDAGALGVFNQIFAIYVVLSQVAVGGIHLSTLKQVSYNQRDLPRCATICTSALILAAILSAIVCIAAILLRDVAGSALKSPPVGLGVALAAPGLVFFSLNKVLLNVLNGLRSMRAFAVLQALRFLLLLTGISMALLLDLPNSYLGAALPAAEITLFVILLTYISVRVFTLRISREAFSWFRAHLDFGLKGCLSGVLTEVYIRGAVLMLGLFFDDHLVGVYSFAAILAEGFSQVSFAVRRNVDPILGVHFAEGSLHEIGTLARSIKLKVYLLLTSVGIVAVAVYPLALRYLVDKPAYEASWGVFAILLTGIVINSGYRAFQGILLQGGRPGTHTLLITTLVVSSLILNAALIPWLKIYGAATATMAVYVLEAVLIAVLARRLFNIRL